MKSEGVSHTSSAVAVRLQLADFSRPIHETAGMRPRPLSHLQECRNDRQVILERNFGNTFLEVQESGSRGVIPNSELLRLVRRNSHLQALSSHHFRLPAPKHERFRILEVCFLRHPMDRLPIGVPVLPADGRCFGPLRVEGP